MRKLYDGGEKLLQKLFMSGTTFVPKNGKGYMLEADKQYTITYDLKDKTFKPHLLEPEKKVLTTEPQ